MAREQGEKKEELKESSIHNNVLTRRQAAQEDKTWYI